LNLNGACCELLPGLSSVCVVQLKLLQCMCCAAQAVFFGVEQCGAVCAYPMNMQVMVGTNLMLSQMMIKMLHHTAQHSLRHGTAQHSIAPDTAQHSTA
jgi:hypothetical protein